MKCQKPKEELNTFATGFFQNLKLCSFLCRDLTGSFYHYLLRIQEAIFRSSVLVAAALEELACVLCLIADHEDDAVPVQVQPPAGGLGLPAGRQGFEVTVGKFAGTFGCLDCSFDHLAVSIRPLR